MRCFLALALCLPLAHAQAPTAPVISARGVTNFFTQEPAPGIVAQGGLVQIVGLNLGPPEGAKAADTPWPTRLGGTQVVIGGKPAALYSVAPGVIIAQVAPDANLGLVDVIVRRGGDTSQPAKVTVAALAPSVRTVKDAGYGAAWGSSDSGTISTTATGLGPTDAKIAAGDVGPSDTPAVPKADISAFVGGMPARVTATASSTRPGEFDVTIAVPAGTRPGDLITLIANRSRANLTVFQPASAPEVLYLPLPDKAPAISTLTDADVDGRFLLATSARGADGCYAGIAADLGTKSITLASDCLTSAAAAALPVVGAPNTNTLAALIGPPSGDAQTGVSATVKIFRPAADTLTVTLPAAASTLTATNGGLVAAIPGTPPQTIVIDPDTGDMQKPAAATGGGAAAGALPGAATPAVTINGLKNVYATANLGQGRTAIVVGDDPLKPTKALFAIVNATGDVLGSKDFPAGWIPLLNAVAPTRAGAPAAAPPRAPSMYDAASRQFFVLARAADASKDAFLAFPTGTGDPKVAAFPDGWFAASCSADIRVLLLDLAGQAAVAAARTPAVEYQASCPGNGFAVLDFSEATVTAVPLPDQGLLRVPSTRADTSLAQMNNYVFGARLDTTRNGTSDAVYVLDGVNASAFLLTVPTGLNGFSDASLQQIPQLNALFAQTIDKIPGDDGLILFNLDLQTVQNLAVPDGFTTVAALEDNGAVCCLATRKLLARALKQGGASLVIYDLLTNELAVAPNPEGVTSFGPPPAAANAGGGAGNGGAGVNAAAAAARVVSSNPRANTAYAIAYNGNRQAGIMVVRIP
jgi:uncharacterized protein (TIGR03437 family)